MDENLNVNSTNNNSNNLNNKPNIINRPINSIIFVLLIIAIGALMTYIIINYYNNSNNNDSQKPVEQESNKIKNLYITTDKFNTTVLKSEDKRYNIYLTDYEGVKVEIENRKAKLYILNKLVYEGFDLNLELIDESLFVKVSSYDHSIKGSNLIVFDSSNTEVFNLENTLKNYKDVNLYENGIWVIRVENKTISFFSIVEDYIDYFDHDRCFHYDDTLIVAYRFEINFENKIFSNPILIETLEGHDIGCISS